MKKVISLFLSIVMLFTMVPHIIINNSVQASDTIEYLSDIEAEAFIGFIYNTSEVTDEMKNDGNLYKFLTGNLTGNDELACKYVFLYTMESMLNQNINDSSYASNKARNSFIEYLENYVGSEDRVAQSFVNSGVSSVKDNLKNILMVVLGLDEHKEIINALDGVVDNVQKGISTPQEIIDKFNSAMNLYTWYTGTERKSMYKYFLNYINNRWMLDDENLKDYFDMMFFDEERSLVQTINSLISWIPYADKLFVGWTNDDCIALINKWGDFVYNVEKSISDTGYYDANNTKQYIEAPDIIIPADNFEYEKINQGIRITHYIGQYSKGLIPDTIDGLPVVEIGDAAFSNNYIINNLTIPASIKIIGNNAFLNCINLDKLIVLSRDISIGDGALNIHMNKTISGKDYSLQGILDTEIYGYDNTPIYNYAISNGLQYNSIDWDGEKLKEARYENGCYYITRASELAWIAYVTNNGQADFEDKIVILQNDIYLNNKQWTPIGTAYSFKGNVEGSGYSIYDMNYNGNLNQYGLIGCYSPQKAYIRNINIYDATISIDTNYNIRQVGLLVGKIVSNDKSSIHIQNCNLSGEITSSGGWTSDGMNNGAVCGLIESNGKSSVTINDINTYMNTNCSTGDGGGMGGIIGLVNDENKQLSINIDNCILDNNLYAYSFFSYSDAFVGGILGRVKGGNLNINKVKVFNTLYSKAYTNRCGGFIGSITPNVLNITNSYINASITSLCTNGDSGAGGFIGEAGDANINTQISNCYVTGTINTGYKAGFIAWSSPNTITLNNCYFNSTTMAIPQDHKVVQLGWFTCNWLKNNNSTSKGLSDDSMKQMSSYKDWDFFHTWIMGSEYPVFQDDYNKQELNNNLNVTGTNATLWYHNEITEKVLDINMTLLNKYEYIKNGTIKYEIYNSDDVLLDVATDKFEACNYGREETISLTINRSFNVNKDMYVIVKIYDSTGNEVAIDKSQINVIKEERNSNPNLFVFDEVTGTILNYIGEEKIVVIPKTINDIPVKTIGNSAFVGNEYITNLVISGEIETIGNSAFHNCNNLQYVSLVGNVKNIEKNSFSECHNLKEVKLCDGIELIGEAAFERCSKITNIKIPNTVTKIEENAFNECVQLLDVQISGNIKEIGCGAFNSTSWYTELTDEFVIINEGMLIKYNGTSEDIVVPDSVTDITCGAFSNALFNSITFGANLKSISGGAFYNTKVNEGIIIPDTVVYLGDYAFRNTSFKSGLQQMVIPQSVQHIGKKTTSDNNVIFFKGDAPVLNIKDEDFEEETSYLITSENYHFVSAEKFDIKPWNKFTFELIADKQNISSVNERTLNEIKQKIIDTDFSTTSDKIFDDQMAKIYISNNIKNILQGTIAEYQVTMKSFKNPTYEISGQYTSTVKVYMGIGEAYSEMEFDINFISKNVHFADDGYIEIYNSDELIELQKRINSGDIKLNIRLMNDIDLSDISWSPIGTATNYFEGIFDGNGRVIKNININSTSKYSGLFGYVKNGTIKNLGIESGTILSTTSCVAGIAGYADNQTIEKCWNGADIVSTATGSVNAGGIVGQSKNGTIINYCYNIGNIGNPNKQSATQENGGLCGYGFNNTYIKNSYNYGTIYGAGSANINRGVGGKITNCYYLDSALYIENTQDDESGIIKKSINEFNNGEVAYLLNNSDDIIYGQKIGEEAYPLYLTNNNQIIHRITLNSCGVIYKFLYINNNNSIKELPQPTLDNCTFINWCCDDLFKEVYNIENIVIKDTNIYALWDYTPYTITYESNGGTLGNYNQEYTIYDCIELPTPIKEGYEFIGWYDNIDCEGDMITEIVQGTTGDRTFYAQWIAKNPDDYYQIYNIKELEWIRNQVDAGNNTLKFMLMDDIDMSNIEWIPIGGTTGRNVNSFKGTFDGNGHVISNMTIDRKVTSGWNMSGLFGNIYNATVKNIIFYRPIISSIANSESYAATVAGEANGNCTLSNIAVIDCNIYSESTGNTWTHATGIIAHRESGTLTMTDCFVDGKIISKSNNNCYAAGMAVSSSNAANLTNCIFIGKASANDGQTYGNTGGIIARSNGNLTNCYYNMDNTIIKNSGYGSSISKDGLLSAEYEGFTDWIKLSNQQYPIPYIYNMTSDYGKQILEEASIPKVLPSSLVAKGEYSNTLAWELYDDGTLKINGDGEVTSNSEQWYDYRSLIKKVELSEGITKIGSKAFYYCDNLKNIKIPDSVTEIDNYAFYDCFNLENVEIPNSITSFGLQAFGYCYSLTNIEIPEHVTYIADTVFSGCGNLNINVSPNNEKYSSKDGVLFNKNQTELLAYAKDKLNPNYTIPDSVTEIAEWAFFYCKTIKSVTIPNNVTTIKGNVFHSCTQLERINIGKNITNIKDSAFYLCNNLKDVYYDGNKADWNKIIIGKDNEFFANNATIHYNSDNNSEITDNLLYLDELKPIINERYTGNQGDSFVHSMFKQDHPELPYGNGNIGIDGTIYEHGLEAWLARWNGLAESSWAYAVYEVENNYKYLTGDISLIKSYNTNNFDSSICFYDYDKNIQLQEYKLTPQNMPIHISVNVENVENLKILVKDNVAVKGGTSFGLVNFAFSNVAESDTNPMATPTATPTAIPTVTPTATATPSSAPSTAPLPSVEPTTSPNLAPTVTPTVNPTAMPTATAEPTARPQETDMPPQTDAPTMSPKVISVEIQNTVQSDSYVSTNVVNISDAPQSGIVIFAAYDDTGALLAVKFEKIENLEANASRPFKFELPSSTATSKLFVWNSWDKIRPLAESVEVK